ncbi:TRAP transporter substrate-binding protein [Thalassobacillus devorans]|uniref:TRAP transporter substrate-binding protein n=1 Tax=Thalassobacillus devorans TaxID=279813 RepID=UPI000A1CC3C5|nr:DctP family TRAP transporter solute-binding subunit [Thalassobacillus devorans]
MKIFIQVLGLALLIGLLAACSNNDNQSTSAQSDSGSNGGEVVLKIGSVNSDKHTLYKGYKKFQEIVEKETGGSVKVEIYPNGQLGDDRTMIEGLQLGTLEAVGVSTSMLANWAPQMLAYDLPFAFPNREVAYKVLDGPYGQKAGKTLESEGIVLLSYMENGFRHLTNDVKEVKSPSDIEGLKIRTMQTPMHIDTWKALGANPTPMAYTELFTAMQQGVIDGQENPYGNISVDKFYEVQKYLTETNHVYNPMGLVISKDFFGGLSEEQQKVIKEAAITASNYQRDLNEEKTKEYKKTLIDNGMQITELTEGQHQNFLESVQSVYSEYEGELGEENITEFLSEVEKY